MSRIKAESDHSKSRENGSAPNGTTRSGRSNGHHARRRDLRVHLEMPVCVYGYGPDKEPFLQDTCTLNVGAHGALITLSRIIDPDQKLIVINTRTQEEIECRVAYLSPTERGKTEVGIEFLKPNPRFWRVAFPPEDWNPAERKRPLLRQA